MKEITFVQVRMHRAGPEHTANVEGVYVTVRWTSKERFVGRKLHSLSSAYVPVGLYLSQSGCLTV